MKNNPILKLIFILFLLYLSNFYIQAQIKNLAQKIFDRVLMYDSANVKKQYHWKQVQYVLKKNEVYIEILRFSEQEKIIYVAFIITSNNVKPEFVILENGKLLENEYYRAYLDGIMNQKIDLYSYKRYWQAIQMTLNKLITQNSEMPKIYFVGNGIYHNINLLTLYNPNSGNYLLDELDLRLIVVQDLITYQIEYKKAKSSFIFITSPTYEDIPKVDKEKSSLDSRAKSRYPNNKEKIVLKDFKNISMTDLKPLPGTKEDVEKIIEMGKAKANIIQKNDILNTLKQSDTTAKENFNEITTLSLNLDNPNLQVISASNSAVSNDLTDDSKTWQKRYFREKVTFIGTLWDLDDKARTFTSIFYKYRFQSMNYQEAFRKAQLEIRKKYPQPYYWGVYVMVGGLR